MNHDLATSAEGRRCFCAIDCCLWAASSEAQGTRQPDQYYAAQLLQDRAAEFSDQADSRGWTKLMLNAPRFPDTGEGFLKQLPSQRRTQLSATKPLNRF